MDWVKALEITGALGFALGMVFRFTPQLKSQLAPRAMFVTALLGNLLLLWQRFVDTAGLASAALIPTGIFGSDMAYAGFWDLLKAPVGVIVGCVLPVAVSYAQTAVGRLIWELGGRFVHKPDTVPLVERK